MILAADIGGTNARLGFFEHDGPDPAGVAVRQGYVEVVFDKTGTLTMGQPEVVEVVARACPAARPWWR